MTSPLPPWVVQRIVAKHAAGWTGKIALNMKDGKVLEVEYTEREREPK